MMNKAEQLKNLYSPCIKSVREYESAQKQYIVTRYFIGERSINEIIYELAVNRADREAGL